MKAAEARALLEIRENQTDFQRTRSFIETKICEAIEQERSCIEVEFGSDLYYHGKVRDPSSPELIKKMAKALRRDGFSVRNAVPRGYFSIRGPRYFISW